MMNSVTSKGMFPGAIAWIGALFIVAVECRADEVAPIKPREVRSANGTSIFYITPVDHYLRHPGHCLGELYRNEAGRKQLVWSRFLINNTAPQEAFISDSGQYVITIDEWDTQSMLPLVIYGRNGKLIHVHTLESLGLANDADEKAMIVGEDYNARWNDGSIVFFGPDEKTLIIRLRWGKMVIVDLARGGLMDDKWYTVRTGWAMKEAEWKNLHTFAHEKAITVAMSMLDAPSGHARAAGAVALGQMKYRPGIPKLRSLLSDSHSYLQKQGAEAKQVYYVRKAAKEALETLGEVVEER
jgi:hypothetical protein